MQWHEWWFARSVNLGLISATAGLLPVRAVLQQRLKVVVWRNARNAGVNFRFRNERVSISADGDYATTIKYGFMITKILSLINEGVCTKELICERLGSGKQTVVAALEWMLEEGFIEEIICNSSCTTCPLKCSTPTAVKMYALTQKGFEHLSKNQAQ